MKAVCEGCSAKYSIADDKIAGKVFKIRCKKCSRVIVLRGTATAAAEPVSSAAVEWHVVQEGRQLGPFDSGEVQRRRAAGELGDDTFVWREGFAEWRALGTVDELRADLSMPMPIAVEPAQDEPVRDDRARAAAGALFGGAAERAVTADASAASRLHGARNESSLLFTLDNLARLAAPAPAAAAAASAPSGARGTGASGEGSGLIDIRSLARTYAPASPRAEGARAAGAGSHIGSMADLPVFPAVAFVEPAVLVPRAPKRDRRLVIGLVASVGMLAICAALLLVVMVTRKGEPTAGAEPVTPPGPRVARVDPPAHRTGSPAVTEPPVAPRHAVTEPAPTRTATPAPAPPAPAPAPTRTTTTTSPAPTRTTTTTSQAPTRTTTTTSQAPTRTTTTPTPTPTPTPAKCDQVTCIVNGFDSDCCRALQAGNPLTPSRTTQPPATSSQLPDGLDRPAITEGLATISTKSCGGSAPAGSLVKAHIKVSAAGAVTAVTLDGSPDPALAACMTTQIQKGRFKKTQRGGSFAYVWRF